MTNMINNVRHDNIKLDLPGGLQFSIAKFTGIGGSTTEVAVLSPDDFIPVAVWYGDGSVADSTGDVLPISANATVVADAMNRAFRWAYTNSLKKV